MALLAGGAATLNAATRAEVLGVRVIQPSNKHALEVFRQAFAGSPEAALQEPRFTAALLENHSGKRVVFYSLKWSAHDANGKVMSTVSSFTSIPSNRDGRDSIPAGGRRIVTPDFTLPDHTAGGPGASQFRGPGAGQPGSPGAGRLGSSSRGGAAKFKDAHDLTVAIDAIGLADGSFAGPDEAGAINSLNAASQARAEIAARVRQTEANGAESDLYKWLNDMGGSFDFHKSQPHPGFSYKDWYLHFQGLHAKQLLRVWSYAGSAAVYRTIASGGYERFSFHRVAD